MEAALEKKKTKRSTLRSQDLTRKEQLTNEIKDLEESWAQYMDSLCFVGPWEVLLLDPGKHHV